VEEARAVAECVIPDIGSGLADLLWENEEVLVRGLGQGMIVVVPVED